MYKYTSYKFEGGPDVFLVDDNIIKDIRLSNVEYIKYRSGLTYSEIIVGSMVHQFVQMYINSNMGIGLRTYLCKVYGRKY